MNQQISSPPIITTTFTAALGIALYGLFEMEILSERVVFIGLSLLLLIFLWLEISRVRRVHPDRWLLNPAVFGSFMTFVMGYGLTNWLFFIPPDQLEILALTPDITPPMVKLMGLVLVAAIAMWIGYWSPIAASLTKRSVISRFQNCFLPRNHWPHPLAIPILVLVATGARLMQIKMGVFGYASTYDRLIEMGAVTQYFTMAASLGKLALVLSALINFSKQRRGRAYGWYIIVLALEVFWGLISGFKSAVVVPFVIAGMCQYLTTGKINKRWMILIIVGLIASYAVIEPFRAARNKNLGSSINSIASIADLFLEGQDLIQKGGSSPPVFLAIASRSNLTFIGSFGISYADGSRRGARDPEFLADLILAPAHAWIPRFLWADKPLGTLGLWYNQVVIGMSHYSSTAMGPVTYLYLAGGVTVVFLVFMIIGVTQRTLFFCLQPWKTSAGGMIFMAILSTISILDSAVNGIFVALSRELPLLIIVAYFLFSRPYRLINHSITISDYH